ncbi:MAG TPA: CoA pyrophosphatase [Gemmatimonadaceae bacterium]|jgi:8-oxo-dGTP pyrophosphatase MutT (NUDIX family)|nr:CoA pyrophosphatase [Gemmatimonadaceae bacterium]
MNAGDSLQAVLDDPLIARLSRSLHVRKPREVVLGDGYRRAAVALVLTRCDKGAPALLMIKRAAFETDPWSGHIALPGGRQEARDASLQATAIRETREETAIDLARDGRIIGRLDDLQPMTTVLPRIIIAPFVAILRATLPVSLSEEVADAFWVPVADLLDPAASREIVLDLTGGPRRVPSIQHGGHVIWGLTERILRQFLSLLAPA